MVPQHSVSDKAKTHVSQQLVGLILIRPCIQSECMMGRQQYFWQGCLPPQAGVKNSAVFTPLVDLVLTSSHHLRRRT